MNYMTLLTDADGTTADRFSFATYRRGGQDVCSGNRGDLILVFCLQGEVGYQSRTADYSMKAGFFTVIDKRAIVASVCPPGTVLLKYSLPPFLAAYIMEWIGGYDISVFPVVPIMPELLVWIDFLVRGMARGESGHFYAVQRRELALRLLEYPPEQLRYIRVPLSNCTRHCATRSECPFAGITAPEPISEIDYSCR